MDSVSTAKGGVKTRQKPAFFLGTRNIPYMPEAVACKQKLILQEWAGQSIKIVGTVCAI